METSELPSGLLEFKRNRAAKILQKFYRGYIKLDRDSVTGLPIDPITGESFDKKYMIKIIYETYNSSTKSVMRRVHCFDITTLWETFKYTKNTMAPTAINPIVNTRFSRKQFKKILKKAAEVNLIPAAAIGDYIKKYGYDAKNQNNHIDANNSSIYEVQHGVDKNKITEIYLNRLGCLLCYYALKDDFENLEKIVYICLEYETDSPDKSAINYIKQVGSPLPKFPPNSLYLLKKIIKKRGLNPGYDNSIVLDPQVESRLASFKVDKYTPLNACAFNQNLQSMTFIMQFSPYLFHPSMGKTDPSALQLVLINPVVNIEIVQILKSYYLEKDMEHQTSLGSIIELASLKLDSQPEIMIELFS